jgi:hypothetical protein
MASPFQQQALRRKLIYILLIVVLFTAAGIFRAYVVEAKAEDLALREQNLGEVEVGGSALQLSLTGSRGFVVCALWTWAIDAQKKNRWNELELYVDSLTRLQPHFISPWLFQSWNLSYNVAVEADQVKDKYFYVTRGVQLLGNGERKNRYHPDLRFNMGFYQQHKIMQSDETNVFRCLYQMSCIPPPERDPAHFWTTDADGRKALDLPTFEKFCADHPQLVRRLHDKLRCNKPEDVVAFLTDNNRIPSIYVDNADQAGPEWRQGRAPLKPMPDRFPALPPPPETRDLPRGTALYDPNELTYNSPLDDAFDAYAAARAWYCYAQEALPLPHPELPGESAEITDRMRQRKPKMTTNIFRNHPPRAQSYIGERLGTEGWFGPEGWLITDWFRNDKFSDGRDARVGTGTNWSADAWRKAHEMWERRGKASLMLLDDQLLAELRALALPLLQSRGRQIGEVPGGAEPPPGDPDHDAWVAANKLFLYHYSQTLTNFRHFYNRSLVEMDPDMIEARRTLFDAVQAIRRGQRDRAADLYESKTGLELMRHVLEKYKDFRDDPLMQDELYEMELRYIKLMQDKDGGTNKQYMAAGSLLGAWAPAGAAPLWPGLIYAALTEPSLTSNLPVPDFLPAPRMRLEAAGPDGEPFIPEHVIDGVRQRHGLAKPKPSTPPPGGMPMPMSPPPPPPLPQPG